MKYFSLEQILDVATSLFEPNQDVDNSTEYQRGVTELIGRLVLDFGWRGEGTDENASLYAKKIAKKLKNKG